MKKHGYKPLEPVAEAKMKEKAEEDGLEQFCHIDGIEIISPDEFEVDENYELETLFYLRDGVVIDGEDHIIDDPTSMVGDAPHYFGTNPGDEDTVYIRNDEKMIKYELLREDRTSEEYFEEYPEDEIREKVSKLIKREYSPDGDGGLFKFYNPPEEDLTKIDIWKQMCWYLDTLC